MPDEPLVVFAIGEGDARDLEPVFVSFIGQRDLVALVGQDLAKDLEADRVICISLNLS